MAKKGRKKKSNRQKELEQSLAAAAANAKLYSPRILVKIFNKYYHTIGENHRLDEGVIRPYSDTEKADIIRDIISNIPYSYQIAIVSSAQYKNYHAAFKMTGVSEIRLRKNLEIGTKYLYWPKNIMKANPNFYNIVDCCEQFSPDNHDAPTQLVAEMFDNKKYIISALYRSGIFYKEQLLKHLDLGWYYLWTIPGIGDNARQIILKAIDRWNGK